MKEPTTEAEMRTQIARSGLWLQVLWVGELPKVTGLAAIVLDPTTKRRYLWPGLAAWRKPIPGADQAGPPKGGTPAGADVEPRRQLQAAGRLVQGSLF